MVQQQRLLDEFMELVQVDSETGEEQEISKVLKQKFSELELHVEEDESTDITGHGAGNLIVTMPATDVGAADIPVLLFTSHMDTVAPGKGIKPRIENGYVLSDGTTILGSDDKAGIAAMLEGIRIIRENNIRHGVIQFVITVGEESGLVGAKALRSDALKAQLGFALDSNGDIGQIAVAAPTQAQIKITFIGKSAHAGVNPEDGISAIQVASKAVSKMKLGRIDHETTANIGRFEGGGATNIVNERVNVYAEARSIKQHKLDEQIAHMREVSEQAARSMNSQVEFESESIYPAFLFDEQDKVVQLAQKAMRRMGLQAKLFHSGGGSDANIFNGLGVPTVNLAVGYEHIHTTKEQISVDNLAKTAQLLVSIVESV